MLLGRGVIVLQDAAGLTADSRAEVRIEDVSRADAPARRVATKVITKVTRKVIHHLRSRGNTAAVPFAIYGKPLLPARRYTVRAQIDVDGDGVIGIGDFLSTV